MLQSMRVLTSSESNEWYTPTELLKSVRQVLGPIELDPASTSAANMLVNAERYYTQAEDGLKQSWAAKTLFLNPPYGRVGNRSSQDVWMAYLIEQLPQIGACIALTKTVPGYMWWDKLFGGLWPGPMCITQGRLSFIPWMVMEKPGQAKAASSLWYYGPDEARFTQVFSNVGRVIPHV